jgi:hypothetical protein
MTGGDAAAATGCGPLDGVSPNRGSAHVALLDGALLDVALLDGALLNWGASTRMGWGGWRSSSGRRLTA